MNAVFLLAVAAGGALGSVARYLVGSGINSAAGVAFPVGTMAVNVLGCFIMGVLAAIVGAYWLPSAEMRAFLAIGVLGGFTTFSSYALDTAILIEGGQHLEAMWYFVASPVLSALGLMVGLHGGRALLL